MKKLFYFLSAFIFILCTAMCCEENEGEPVYTKLTGIEAFNINNEGAMPFITEDPVKKEAYGIGLKYYTATPYKYLIEIEGSPSVKIFCNNDFDEKHPAGSDITSYFKPARYTFNDLIVSYVLLTIPQPGQYSFKVITSLDNGSFFESDTPLINLY